MLSGFFDLINTFSDIKINDFRGGQTDVSSSLFVTPSSRTKTSRRKLSGILGDLTDAPANLFTPNVQALQRRQQYFFFKAEVSVRSPQKYLFSLSKLNLLWIKTSI